jgi:hypothetical protein
VRINPFALRGGAIEFRPFGAGCPGELPCETHRVSENGSANDDAPGIAVKQRRQMPHRSPHRVLIQVQRSEGCERRLHRIVVWMLGGVVRHTGLYARRDPAAYQLPHRLDHRRRDRQDEGDLLVSDAVGLRQNKGRKQGYDGRNAEHRAEHTDPRARAFHLTPRFRACQSGQGLPARPA